MLQDTVNLINYLKLLKTNSDYSNPMIVHRNFHDTSKNKEINIIGIFEPNKKGEVLNNSYDDYTYIKGDYVIVKKADKYGIITIKFIKNYGINTHRTPRNRCQVP